MHKHWCSTTSPNPALIKQDGKWVSVPKRCCGNKDRSSKDTILGYPFRSSMFSIFFSNSSSLCFTWSLQVWRICLKRHSYWIYHLHKRGCPFPGVAMETSVQITASGYASTVAIYMQNHSSQSPSNNDALHKGDSQYFPRVLCWDYVAVTHHQWVAALLSS